MEEKTSPESSPMLSDALPVKKTPNRKLTTKEAKALAEKAKKSPRHGKHGKQKITLAKEEVFRLMQERLAERALKLIDTQTVIAHGTIKVYKMVSHFQGSGKNRRKVRGKPELVTNEDEIARCIDYQYGDGESPNDDDEYFFVSTKDPDNRAIQAQIDRVFGKSAQPLDLTSGGKQIQVITGMEIIKEPKKNEDPIQV